MSSRRIATVAVALAIASGAGWALMELGRSAELAPVPPIVIREGSASDPGTNPDKGDGDPEPSQPGGPEGNPTGGAAQPPAPPPPPAGDDDGDDGADDSDDDTNN